MHVCAYARDKWKLLIGRVWKLDIACLSFPGLDDLNKVPCYTKGKLQTMLLIEIDAWTIRAPI